MEQMLRLSDVAEAVVDGRPPPAAPSARPVWTMDGAAKRVLDVVLALVLLLLALPILVCAAVAIRLGSPGGSLYRQRRVGRDGQVFWMLKLRTMCDGFDEYVPKRPGDPRVTRVGRLLRTTSIDELPQLWNVVRGEMSLVGPRPLPLAEHVARGAPGGARLTVRPGLSGPWQVQGRNEIPFPQRLALEESYALRRTFAGDLRLLAKTLPAVLSRRGAY